MGLRPRISRKPSSGDAEIASREDSEAGWGTGGARCACVEKKGATEDEMASPTQWT